MFRLALTVVVCLCPAGLLCQEPAVSVRHSGVVRSAGQPIPGATVTATQAGRKLTTTTDETGMYRFENLAPGAGTLEVQMVGFSSARREVQAGASEAALEWSLEVQPRVARRVQERRAQGFQNLALTQSGENAEIQAEAALGAASYPAGFSQEANANEAFLLNGSLSGNLEPALREAFLEQFRGGFEQFGGEGMMGPMAAARTFGSTEGPGEAGAGGGQGGPAAGGRPGGGAGGGPGPGGPGMLGGGPGPGGGGGLGGRGAGGMGGPRLSERAKPGRGPAARPWAGDGAFGNRIGRGQEGLRGMATYSLNTSALNARPFSLTGQTVEKPSYSQSRFGFSLGGPLKIPKIVNSPRTFIFVNYSGTRGQNLFSTVSTLPTAAEREGDFSASVGRTSVQVYDPKGTGPFPGNRIPASRIDSVALGLLPFFPLPNQPGSVQNYQYVTSNGSNNNNLGVRLNRSLTRKDRMDVNTNVQWRNSTSAQLFGFRDSTSGRGISVGAGWTHNFTRTTINTLRWNFNRNRNQVLPFFAYGTDVAGALGITGVSRDPINYGPPNLNFTNFGGLSDASASLGRNQTSAVNEGVMLVRGSHNLSFGGDYRRMQLNTRTDQNARGTFTFTGLATSAFDNRNQPLAGTGFDFADFLLGLPQSSSIRFGGASTYFRASVVSGNALDDWRIRPNLTLNAGLRYEYFQPFREKWGHMANLDIAPGFDAVAVVTPGQSGPYTGQFPDGLIDPDKNNFSPRLGLAWRPFSKRQLLVRAGYGIFFNGSIYNQFPSRLAAQPPFANTATLNTSLARTLTLKGGLAAAPSQTITNTYAVDRHYQVGYAQTWSFSIQQTLRRSLVAEVGYLGTKGTRLDIQRQPNRAAPGSPLTAEQRRLIGNAVGFTWDTSDGNSIYHGGQVRLMRRFARGVSANVLYVYSKSIDNASTLGGGGAVVAQNDQDLRAERGRSSFDQRHTLSLFYVLASPVREGGRALAGAGWAARLLRGWSLSGGLTASSGTPLTARVLGNQSDTGGTGAIGSGRANATGLLISSATGFFNLAAFAIPPSGTFGNAGRNTIDGPTRVSLNLSVSRAFRIDDRRRLELRVDSQNFTNHVSYTSLGTVVNAANYGLPTATAGMRTITPSLRLRF